MSGFGELNPSVVVLVGLMSCVSASTRRSVCAGMAGYMLARAMGLSFPWASALRPTAWGPSLGSQAPCRHSSTGSKTPDSESAGQQGADQGPGTPSISNLADSKSSTARSLLALFDAGQQDLQPTSPPPEVAQRSSSGRRKRQDIVDEPAVEEPELPSSALRLALLAVENCKPHLKVRAGGRSRTWQFCNPCHRQ